VINDVTIDAINFGSVQAEREFLVSIGSHTEYTLAVVHTVAIPTGGTVEIVTTSDSLIILHNGRELRRFGLPENPTVSIWGSDLDDNVEIRPNDTGSQVDIRFDAGAGNDTVALIGGSLLRKGDLDIFGGSGNDTIDLSRGTAIRAFARGDDGNDTLIGSDNADLLTGDAGDDVIRGGAGNDILSGDSRGGLFTGIPGDDTIDGGEGIDTVFASGDVDFWLDNEKLVGHGTDQLTSIESAWIIGGPSANLIRTHRFVSTAGRGVIVNGAGGDDSISGGRFDDAIRGGDGNDLIYGLHGNDVLSGEAGNDTLLGGSNGDLILGNGGNDVAVGRAGNDTIRGGTGNELLLGRRGNDFLDGQAGDDTVIGGRGDDTIPDQEGADFVYGGAGHDIISDRGTERDTLVGGTGTDVIQGDASDLISVGLPPLLDEEFADVRRWIDGV